MTLIRRRAPRPTMVVGTLFALPLALVIGVAGLSGSASAAPSVAATFATVNNPGVNAAQSEAYFSNQINAARASAGVAPLSIAWDVVNVARTWSSAMAGGVGLAHNPNLRSQITNWSWLGENVGVGYSDDSLWSAFMNSPHHRDNILDPNYTEMGVGVVIGSDGYINVTQDFRRPLAASAPAPVSVVPAAAPSQPQAPVAPLQPAATQAPPPPPDPAALARAALLSRIVAARSSGAAGGTVLRALGFATVMTGR